MIPVREHPSAGLVAAFFALFLISFVAVWALPAAGMPPPQSGPRVTRPLVYGESTSKPHFRHTAVSKVSPE